SNSLAVRSVLRRARSTWPKRSNGRMLCPMNALLRRVGPAVSGARRLLCGGCVAASLLVSPYARAQEAPADQVDPWPTEAPPDMAPPEAPPPSEPPGGVLPGPNAEPSGPLPELPSSAPQAPPPVDPANPTTYDPATDTDPAALSDFHDTLSPYGTWA